MAALITGTVEVSGGVTTTPDPRITGTIQVRGDIVVRSSGNDRRIVLVDNTGEVLPDGFLDTAVMGEITWEPSRTTTWSATVPLADDKVDAILGAQGASGDYGVGLGFIEAQLWRGDRLLTWGPITSVLAADGGLTVVGADCGFYYDRRIIGPGARPNLITWDDQAPMNGWTILYPQSTFDFGPGDPNVLWVNSCTVDIDGKQWLQFNYNTGPAADPLSQPMAMQTVRLNAAAFSHRVTLSALYYNSYFEAPNSRKSGLGLAVLPVGWTDLYTDAVKVQWATIDENFPHGDGAGPQRVSVSVDVGVASEYVVAAIITVPRGYTYVRDVFLDWDGGLEFSGEDQVDIAFKVSDHITGNASSVYTYATHHPLYPYAGEDYGKSDLNIEVDGPDSGVMRSRRYLFTTQQTGSAALQEFANYDDGLEYGFSYTKNSRTLNLHHPKMGTYRPKCVLRQTSAGGNVLAWSWSFEGQQAANQVTVRAPGDSLRVGTASNTSSFANSLTLEQQLQAPVDTADEALSAMAAKRLAQSDRPVNLEVTVSADLWDRGLWVGDRVPVYIAAGSFYVDDIMRVVRMTLTPDDRLKLKLAPWDGGAT